MKKSLFRYKLCKKRIDIKIKLLEAFSLIRLNKLHIQELERKLAYIEHRIANLEYFMKINDIKDSKKRKHKNIFYKVLFVIFNNQYTTLIIRIIIGIASLIFILEWANKNGMRSDLLHIISGVITK